MTIQFAANIFHVFILVFAIFKIMPETFKFLKSRYEEHGIPFGAVAGAFIIFLIIVCSLLSDFGYRTEEPQIVRQVNNDWILEKVRGL